MVLLMLMITADLENLTDLQPQSGCNDPDFPYMFKVKCGNCGEVSQKETCVSLKETITIPRSRGIAHLFQKPYHRKFPWTRILNYTQKKPYPRKFPWTWFFDYAPKPYPRIFPCPRILNYVRKVQLITLQLFIFVNCVFR
nr:uncharacterized protein LOC112697699 isoform X5 [Arachis hypogaea]